MILNETAGMLVAVGFRDDNEALRARIRSLEERNKQLEQEKLELELAMTGPPPDEGNELVEPPLAEPFMEDNSSDLENLARARETAVQRAEQEAEAKRAEQRRRDAAKLKGRPERVVVSTQAGRTTIRFLPVPIKEKLKEQFGWGFGFAFVNPGLFVMVGLGLLFALHFELGAAPSALLTVSTWTLALAAMNWVWARFTRPHWRLEMDSKHFALFTGSAAEPSLVGPLHKLTSDLSDPDEARLGEACFEDGRSRVDIDKLSATDLRTLRAALQGARRARIEEDEEDELVSLQELMRGKRRPRERQED